MGRLRTVLWSYGILLVKKVNRIAQSFYGKNFLSIVLPRRTTFGGVTKQKYKVPNYSFFLRFTATPFSS